MEVKEKMISLERIFDELYELCDEFSDDWNAIEALEAVKFWAMEETVSGVNEDKFVNEETYLDLLFSELGRLCVRFADEPNAIEALEAVRFWAVDESLGRNEQSGPMDMTKMSRLILGLRKLGLGDKELADFLLWVESGDAKYEPGQLGGQQEEGQ